MVDPDTSPARDWDTDQLELVALRTVVAAVRDGLSLDGTVSYCLDETLRQLGLDFGCLYVRRHDYLLRIAARGLSLPNGTDTLLPLTEAEWVQRPFVAQSGSQPAGRAPDDVRGKTWMSLPLRIGGQLVGMLLIGGYSRTAADLPPISAARRVADHLAVAIDNAERFQQIRGILNDTRDIIFRTDAHGRWTYLNAAWQETMGEPVVVALGRRVLSYVASEHRRRLGRGIDALVPRGSVIGRQTLPFQLRDGKVRWLDVQARVVRNDQGHVVGTAGAIRDVSLAVRQARELYEANEELRRHTAELESANRDLAEADRVKSEFLHTVSHELRTPLSLVNGYAELLAEGIPDAPTPGQREYLDLISAGGAHLLQLIQQLLELANLEAGKVAVNATPTALLPALEEACARLAGEAGQAGVTIAPLAAPLAPVVLAEPERLTQVAEILLGNAVKFSHHGGAVRVRVDLRATPQPVLNGDAAPTGAPRYVQVTVEDQGEGVPPERLSRLFRKFVQADGSDTRAHGGLGLGLVIGKALVEMMGGQIDLHSAGAGQGCAVGFTVPLVDS